MGNRDGLKKNWQILQEQAEEAWIYILVDIHNGRQAWKAGRYGRALHNWLFGPPAEVFEHMHRWIYYAFLLSIVHLIISFF